MKCPNCDEEVKDGVKFCTKCGTKLENKKDEKTSEKESKKEEKKPAEKKKEKSETKEEKEPKKETKQKEKTEIKKEDNKEKAEPKKEEKKKESENKKEDKPKKKKEKKIIIAILIIALIAVGAVTGIMFYPKEDNDDKEEKTSKNLEWGEVYLEILNDDSKLENLDDMKMGLIDLDQDGIPELILKGINAAKERLASIYKINENNEVDTVKVLMDDDFELKLVYDLKVDKYVWYAIAKENTETPEVYDLNIETKKYEKELLDRDFKNDIIIVETEENKMVDFSKDLSKDERKAKLEAAKEIYKPTEELITDEIKEKVELAKAIRDIEKLDPNKDIVYTVVSKSFDGNNYEYPCINIKSDDVQKINAEIKENYGFPESMNSTNYPNYIFLEDIEISYNYTINKNVLSLIVWHGGNESIWADTYNVDLKTTKKISNEDLISQYGFSKDDITSRATEAVKKEYNNLIEKEKKSLGSMWDTMGYADCLSGWEKEISDYIKEIHVFVNKNNELCVLGKYPHAGGQWSCTQTVVVNITNNYQATELPFKNGKTFEHSVANNPIEEPKTTPKPSETPKPSQSTNQNSNNPTEKGISQEEAVAKLKNKLGSELSYIYEGWAKDENGKQYYVYDIKQKVDDGGGGYHLSWAGAICVAVDGKAYRQLDMPQYELSNGSTISNMYPEESF